MIFEYVALFMLIFAVTMSIYIFIYIHDIPYKVAQKRNHPQLEAIHIACWLSLFTLHAIWPIVFIWAVMDKPLLRVATSEGDPAELDAMRARIAELEGQVAELATAAVAPVDATEGEG